MATWETTADSQAYIAGKRSGSGARITKVTDNKDGETTFEFGESVTVTLSNGGTLNYIFRGTLTHEGVEYPVVGNASGSIQYVIGSGISTSLPAEIAPAVNAPTLNISTFTVCFFPGTLIATPFGERKVEELVSGDLVLIGDSGAISATWFARMGEKFRQRLGFARAVPVKWVGRQTISTLFGPAERLMPVRFAAGSLGGGNLFYRIAI